MGTGIEKDQMWQTVEGTFQEEQTARAKEKTSSLSLNVVFLF